MISKKTRDISLKFFLFISLFIISTVTYAKPSIFLSQKEAGVIRNELESHLEFFKIELDDKIKILKRVTEYSFKKEPIKVFHKDKRDNNLNIQFSNDDLCHFNLDDKKSYIRHLNLGIDSKHQKIFKFNHHYRIELSKLDENKATDLLTTLKDFRDLCLLKKESNRLATKLISIKEECSTQKNCSLKTKKLLKQIKTPQKLVHYLEEKSFPIPQNADATGRELLTYEKFQNVSLRLLNGKESFTEKMKAIGNAKKSIYIEVLDILGDFTSIEMMEKLIEKRKEGVDVKFVIDSFSMGQYGLNPFDHNFDNAYIGLKRMMAAGVEVRGFACDPIKEVLAQFSPFHPLKFLKRKHEKIFVIDGELINAGKSKSFMGGMNIADSYFELSHSPFMDDDIIVKGPIENDLLKVFNENFEFYENLYSRSGVKLTCINPYKNNLNSKKYNEFLSKKLKKHKYRFNSTQQSEYNYVQNEVNDFRNSYEIKEKMTRARMRYYQNRPRNKEKIIRDAYIHLFNHAKEDITIKNAYFLPSRKIKDALINAKDRGVNVTIITNHMKTNKELWFTTIVGRLYYTELIQNGIKIKEWMGETESGISPKFYTLHSKVAVIDNNLMVIGSYNLDNVSESWNSEDIIITESKIINQKMRDRIFEFRGYTDPVTEDEALDYGTPDNLKESFKYFLAKLINSIFS